MDLMVYKGLLAITIYFERESASTFSLELWTMSVDTCSTEMDLGFLLYITEVVETKIIPHSSHQLTWFHLLETAEYVYEEGQTATPPSLCLCEDADYELLSASSTLLLVTSNHRGSLLILTLSCDDGDGGL
ncbi:hypothetical protein NC653_022554 [Populus alba x Populus x berolinensis]|uniref:Uncharacterized protein n=1 Tax=Populus alba x Populus x berolinensis TaxID=444605 RepID=A0AAD6MF53_9ROSI|nr:hypothetical protein NC653_022554 [Populus alba x Populus x berolinensis]